MFQNKIIYLLIISLVAILFSCTKDNDTTDIFTSKKDLLTTGTWILTNVTSEPPIDWDYDGNEESNIYDVMDNCDKDDLFIFNTNDTYRLEIGETACNGQSNPIESGGWAFNNDQTEINLSPTQIPDYKIVISQLTSSTFTYTQNIQLDSNTYIFTYTYSKQ